MRGQLAWMTARLSVVLLCLTPTGSALAQAGQPLQPSAVAGPARFVNVADYRSIQDAIDSFGRDPQTARPGIVFVPRGRHVITAPLKLRKLRGLTLRGEGAGSVIAAEFPAGPEHEARKWPIIDMTGATRIKISDLSISTVNDAARSCGCGILQAREAGESAGFHVMENVHVGGFFNGAALWNAASEVNTYVACNFTNFKNASSPTAGGWCAFFGNGKPWSEDPNKLTPPYSLVRCPDSMGTYRGQAYNGATQKVEALNIVSYGGSTMQQTSMYNCTFSAYQGAYASDPSNGNSVAIMIHGGGYALTDLHFTGGGISMGGSADRKDQRLSSYAGFYFDGGPKSGSLVLNVSMEHMRCETLHAKHFMYVSERAGNIRNLVVRDNTLQSLESTFRFDVASRCGPMLIENNYITNHAGYDWGTADRAVYQSVRDTGVVMRGNPMPMVVPNDPTRPNLVYKCTEFSENCTIDTNNISLISTPPAGTFGLLLDEYWMPNPSATGGLRRLRLGSSSVAENNVVPNVQILTRAPADDAARYQDGDVVFAVVGGVYRVYLRGGGSWHYVDMKN